MNMNLIVGLGNPGRAYAHNRHNVGFRCVNYLGKVHDISLKQRQCQAQIGTGLIGNTEVVLAKPRTFMNLSGKSVKSLMQRFRVTPSDIVVIHDDLDLPLGRLKITQKGGSAGHKGIASIIQQLGTDQFLRLRLGIGKPEPSEDTVDYVLRPFRSGELKLRNEVIARAAEAIEVILTEGVEAAQNRFHKSEP